MNLVQLASDLEFVPKDQLAQMSQDPNTSYPPYLVLAEIQRRTANEKAYAAAQPQPTSTVAEEVVGEFMQPQGLQAGMPPESAPTDVFSSGEMGMPASAPMQQPMQQPMQMASGGLTGYAAGDRTSLNSSFSDPMRQAMLAQLGFPSGMTNEQLDAAIIEQKKMSDISSGSNVPKTAGDLKEGLMQFGFGDARPDSETPVFSRMTDEFTDYLNVIPGAGAGILGLKTAIKTGEKGIKKGLQKLGDRARRNDPEKIFKIVNGKKVLTGSTEIGKDVATGAVKKTGSTLFGSVPRAATTTYGAGLTAEGISNLVSQGETVNKSDPFFRQNEDGTFTNTYTEELNKQKKLAGIAAKQKEITDAANAEKALRIEAIEKAERKDRGYDLTQLGGLIMGSKSIGDLGMGIAGMAQQKQARADTLKSEESKDAYYRASANKIQAEIDSLPLEKTQSLLDSVLKVLENEDGKLTEEQIINYGIYRDNLQLKLLKSEGIDLSATGVYDLEADRA